MWHRDRLGLILPLSVLLIVTGLATVVLVIPRLAESQAAASPVGLLDRLRYVADLYASTMSGEYLYLLVTKRPLPAGSLMNAWSRSDSSDWRWRPSGRRVAPAAQGGCLSGDRVLLFHLAIFVLIAVQLLITKKAWGPHHIMMLYPFQLFVTFGAAVSLAGTWGAVSVATVLVASGLHVGAAYQRGFRPTAEFEPQWSPVVYELVDYLNRHPAERIVSVDWGTHNQIWALGNPRTRSRARDRWPDFRTPGDVRHRSSCIEEISRVCTDWPCSMVWGGTSCRPCGRISWLGPRPSGSSQGSRGSSRVPPAPLFSRSTQWTDRRPSTGR